MPARTAFIDRTTLIFLALTVILVALRVLGLQASPLNLQADEAQYWAWSRHLDFGYFSKPPLIAWAVAAATAQFGDAEWVVRLTAPLAHGVAALALYALGRSMYGAAAGFWAGFSWLVLPAVWLSSGLMSTDALVLPLWSVALFCLWRLTVARSWTWAAALGLAIGVGVLAKYAMLYFPLCLLLAAYWSRPVRDALRGGRWAAIVAVALAAIAPNIIWNVNHHFETVAHTASNAHLTRDFIHFDEVLEFIASQSAVLGPLTFLALLWLLWRAWTRAAGTVDEDRFLIAFILPPFLIIMAQAFLSRANGNWAAVAFPASVVWIAGNLASSRDGRRVLIAATVVNIALGLALTVAAIRPDLADRAPWLANSIKRARGWDVAAHEIAQRAMPHAGEAPYTAVLVDDRDTFYELTYYWRDARRQGAPLPPLRMWLLYAEPYNSAESSDPMRVSEGGRVLIVHQNPRYMPFVAGDFTQFRTVDTLRIPLGSARPRELEISVGEGFAPARRDAAFMQRVHGPPQP